MKVCLHAGSLTPVNNQKIMGTKTLNTNEMGITGSVGAAAVLLTLGYQLESSDRDSEGDFLFVFKQQDGIDDAMEQFDKGDLTVSAKEYYDRLSILLSFHRAQLDKSV